MANALLLTWSILGRFLLKDDEHVLLLNTVYGESSGGGDETDFVLALNFP